MQQKLAYIACMALALVFLVLQPVYAQTPEPFQRTGVIEVISLDEGRLVIYDVSYRFPASTPVYIFDPQTDHDNPEKRKRASQQSLRVGMRVGYTVVEDDGSQHHPLLTEAWILPSENTNQNGKRGPVRSRSQR